MKTCGGVTDDMEYCEYWHIDDNGCYGCKYFMNKKKIDATDILKDIRLLIILFIFIVWIGMALILT